MLFALLLRPSGGDNPAGTPIPLPDGKKLTAEQTISWARKRDPFVWSEEKERLLRAQARQFGYVEEGGKLVRREFGQTISIDPKNPDRTYYVAAYLKSKQRWGMFHGLGPSPTSSWAPGVGMSFTSQSSIHRDLWDETRESARQQVNSAKSSLKTLENGAIEDRAMSAGVTGTIEAAFPKREQVQAELPKEWVESARQRAAENMRTQERMKQDIKDYEVLAERASVESLKKHRGMKVIDSVASYYAENPDVAAVAILDLYSQERPLLIKCFLNDGKVIREARQLPTKDLDKSLREYIYSLQCDL